MSLPWWSQHLLGQLRLGRKTPVLRNAGLPAALAIVRPCLGHIEFPIQQDLAQRAGIAQKHPNWAVLHFSDRAAILPGDTSRVTAFLEKPGFVEDQHAVGIPQRLPAIGAQLVADGVGVPIGAAQQILEAVGSRLTADFRHLPAILALDRTEQAAQIRQDPVAGLRAGEIGGQPSGHVCQVGLAACDGAGRRIRRGRK